MGLETGTYISDLNSSNPVAGDPVNEGDDHIRLVKSTVKATFPSITGAVTSTHTELNLLDGVTANTTQLNYIGVSTLGTVEASKAVTADASKDITGVRNLTVTGTITIGSNTATTLQAVYPVGSIYINAAVATNPGTLLGFGTWTAFGAGRVIVGLDGTDSDFDTAQETGGAKTHTLSLSETPSHAHTVVMSTSDSDEGNLSQGASSGTSNYTTSSVGGNGAHNNVQPYIVAYMWRRTA
jgi:microcystin-dependent protein